jgi:uncharacterized protein YbjQ (UPF0145 family)
MAETSNCPNCDTDLKTNARSLSENKIKIINEYHEPKSILYCTKCGPSLYQKYRVNLLTQRNSIIENVQELIEAVPVVTTHSPLNWEYDILNIVTGQTTTGTGIISEFASSFADFFGTQSNRYNDKLKAGENLCLAKLRKQTIDLGGNAIIAADIDYSEVGGQKGMLLVCMAGTAIKLRNTELLGNDRNEKIGQLMLLVTKLNRLISCDITEI